MDCIVVPIFKIDVTLQLYHCLPEWGLFGIVIDIISIKEI